MLPSAVVHSGVSYRRHQLRRHTSPPSGVGRPWNIADQYCDPVATFVAAAEAAGAADAEWWRERGLMHGEGECGGGGGAGADAAGCGRKRRGPPGGASGESDELDGAVSPAKAPREGFSREREAMAD